MLVLVSIEVELQDQILMENKRQHNFFKRHFSKSLKNSFSE